MKILACTGITDLENELAKYYEVLSIKVLDDVLDNFLINQSFQAAVISAYLPSFQADFLTVCSELKLRSLRVIALCGDNKHLMQALFNNGIYDFIPGNKVSIRKIIERINNPMGPEEAITFIDKTAPLSQRRSFIGTPGSEAESYKQQGYRLNQKESNNGYNLESVKAGSKIAASPVNPEETFVVIKQEKEEEQEQEDDKGPSVLGFWSAKPGSGTGSIARAVAITASHFLKVLLVETDFRYPSAMFSLKMIDDERCIEKAIQAVQENSGSVIQSILNKRNYEGKTDVPEGLHLLAPSIERGLELFPRVESEEVMASIHESVKEDFDLIIYDLPSELDSFLTVGAMKQCTHLIIVIDGRPAVLSILEKRINLLRRLKIKAIENCVAVTNKLPEEVGVQKIQQICGLRVIQNIPYDREMNEAVMHMLPGGRVFMKSIEDLCSRIGIGEKRQMKDRPVSKSSIWTRLKGGTNKWTLGQLFLTTR